MSIRQNKNETTKPQGNLRLASLVNRQSQAPFDGLIAYLKRQLPINPNDTAIELHACMFNWVKDYHSENKRIEFSPQTEYEDDNRYYEQIIFEDNKVPSRDNWHDFFNALIWLQFTNTKKYFNQQHIAQMQEESAASTLYAKQRSPIRDRITHFDECGLLLVTDDDNIEGLIQQHRWIELFVDNKHKWHNNILPFIVGHALWEMLLQPFIGLTAKVCVISVGKIELEELKKLEQHDLFQRCDELLLNKIQKLELLSVRRPWLPLPLLGIPRWSVFAQDNAFYQNQSYFMPLANKDKA